jgi:hypothetical protein
VPQHRGQQTTGATLGANTGTSFASQLSERAARAVPTKGDAGVLGGFVREVRVPARACCGEAKPRRATSAGYDGEW